MAREPLPIDVAVPQIISLVEIAGPVRSLPFYWDVGATVLRSDGGYRSHTRETIAKKLAEADIAGLQKENLAKAAKFSDSFGRDLATKLEKAGVSWRNAAMLCSAHIDNARDELIGKVLSGKLHPSDLGRVIKRKAGIEAVSGNRSIDAAAKRARTDITFLAKLAFKSGLDEEANQLAEESLIELNALLEELLEKRRPPTEPKRATRSIRKTT